MKWRWIFFVTSLVFAAGVVWQGFVLWDSYANSSYEQYWADHRLIGKGNVTGHWEWEEGPIEATSENPNAVVLSYPLSGEYAEYAEHRSLEVVDRRKESASTETIFYAAEDHGNWLNTLSAWLENLSESDKVDKQKAYRAFLKDHAMHVFAVRKRSIPFQWLPVSLFVLSASLLFLVSAPLGRFRSMSAFLFSLATVCLLVLWWRSFLPRGSWRNDSITYARHGPPGDGKSYEHTLGTSKGSFLFISEAAGGMIGENNGWHLGLGMGSLKRSFIGFGFEDFKFRGVDTFADGWMFGFPICLPLLLLMIYPSIFLTQTWKKSRRKKHQC
jgi:hypothetical protein